MERYRYVIRQRRPKKCRWLTRKNFKPNCDGETEEQFPVRGKSSRFRRAFEHVRGTATRREFEVCVSICVPASFFLWVWKKEDERWATLVNFHFRHRQSVILGKLKWVRERGGERETDKILCMHVHVWEREWECKKEGGGMWERERERQKMGVCERVSNFIRAYLFLERYSIDK